MNLKKTCFWLIHDPLNYLMNELNVLDSLNRYRSIRTTGDNSFFWRDQSKIPPVLYWNAKMGDNRFSSWWVLGFVIPRLRQLVFPERVWLLAKWDDARNIAIWPASSYGPVDTHTRKNNEVTTMFHSSYLPPAGAGTNATHSWPIRIIAELTPKDPVPPDERFMLTRRVLDMDQVTRCIQNLW